MKYALKVAFDNDYIYVSRPTGRMYEVEPVLFDSYEEAQSTAEYWGKGVVIVEYKGCPPCNNDCNQGRDCPARK